ncbi:MAG: FAD-dependent oxidoreductase [Patescibacteria group bacterium]
MKYDIIICGGGIAGLWLLNTLTAKGLNVVLIEKNTLGGVQTLASQGMIHGGQKYLLQGHATPEALSIAKMPERWQKCFEGSGDINLSRVSTLSETQVMWPAGSKLSEIGLVAAAKLVNAKTKKLSPNEYPKALRGGTGHGPVYELPEKVMDTHSLVSALVAPHTERIVKGDITKLAVDGSLTVNGLKLEAQLIISTAGTGNEEALRMLGVSVEEHSQRRPLRQIMIKTMEYPLYGHGVVNNPKPRVTITSHPLPEGGYVWYLGGAIAEQTATLSDAEAITYARKEMQDIFPEIDWFGKHWASWLGDRAEARHPGGVIQDGPAVQEYGKVLVVWPTKLTFMPALSDNVHAYVDSHGLTPSYTDEPPILSFPEGGVSPWESAHWAHKNQE